MKKYIVCVFTLITHLGYSQERQLPVKDAKPIYNFFYIINFSDEPPVATKNAIIDPQSTISWYHLGDSATTVRRLLKVDEIYVITLKPNTKLLTLNQLLDIYNIQPKYRKIKIKIDDDLIDYPETILISQNQIDQVKIVKRSDSFYLWIILKSYFELKKELENEKKRGEIRVGHE